MRVKEIELCKACQMTSIYDCGYKCRYWEVCNKFRKEKYLMPSWFYSDIYYGDSPDRIWSDEE